jgi:hypothetical protein
VLLFVLIRPSNGLPLSRRLSAVGLQRRVSLPASASAPEKLASSSVALKPEAVLITFYTRFKQFFTPFHLE